MNFDRIAPLYDKLVRFVFGKAVYQAQTRFLNEIDKEASVLILGGGTGWLLAELVSAKPRCKVVYIEASEKMLQMAQKAVAGSAQTVVFIHGTEREIPVGSSFDVIITHFYLDLFPDHLCRGVCRLIRSYCHAGSLWLACDFIKITPWHSLMLRLMYLFFRLTSDLKIIELPDWRKCIQESDFGEIDKQYFFKSFICTALYRLGNDRG